MDLSISGFPNPKQQKGRGAMAIRVFVKRRVSDENAETLRGFIEKLRTGSTGRPGYISGETLRRIDRPGEILVISKWKTRKEWQDWFESSERAALQQKIDALIGAETTYEMYDFD
jgi:heme-degrading monooxygenase HmoA